MSSIQRMKLTGAAILVSRGMKVLQAAPAAYPYRSAYKEVQMFRSIMFVTVTLFASALASAADQPLAAKGSPPMIGITWGTAKGDGVVSILVMGIQTRIVSVEVE